MGLFVCSVGFFNNFHRLSHHPVFPVSHTIQKLHVLDIYFSSGKHENKYAVKKKNTEMIVAIPSI